MDVWVRDAQKDISKDFEDGSVYEPTLIPEDHQKYDCIVRERCLEAGIAGELDKYCSTISSLKEP